MVISYWLVPWLVLASQLPFETKDLLGNFMAFFLAVGSPMLITYSLAITVLNARWIDDEFRNLKSWNKELGGKMVGVLNDACQFLVASQCVPIQLVLGPEYEFVQLIVDPRKRKWWKHLVEEIEKTKREWCFLNAVLRQNRTYSLRFQIMGAFFVQVLAVIIFFDTSDDDNSIGTLRVTVNSLWMWMIPICLAWVWISSQTSHSTIRDALQSASQHCFTASGELITGIRDRTGDERRIIVPSDGESFEMESLVNRPEHEEAIGGVATSLHEVPRPARIASFRTTRLTDTLFHVSIAGDAILPGPIHNYARLWTHMAVARELVKGFKAINYRLAGKRVEADGTVTIEGKMPVFGPVWNNEDYDINFRGKPFEMARYIGVMHDGEHIPLYPANGPTYKARMTAAALWLSSCSGARLVLQLLLVILVGLGCLSGPYLLYGLAATCTWALLTISARLSQSYYTELVLPKTRPCISSEIKAILAVLTRLLGKLLAVASTLWIIVLSGLQFSNVYDSCWCNSCAVTKGVESYVLIFASNEDVVDAALKAWVWGIAWSFITVFATLLFVGVGKGRIGKITQ